MPIAELRVRNFRAFADSGIVTLGAVTPIVGRNDAGKSGVANREWEKPETDPFPTSCSLLPNLHSLAFSGFGRATSIPSSWLGRRLLAYNL